MKTDCHIHAALGGVDWRADIARNEQGPEENRIRKMLEAYREAGYTYLRDGGDKWGISEKARLLAPEYGITYKTPLSPLCKAGHYGSFIGTPWEDMKEYTKLVVSHRKAGADFIKLMISGLMDFDHCRVLTQPGLEKGEIRELIHIAKSEGFSVMIHGNGPRTVEAAAAAGADSIEHGAYLDIWALETMKDMAVVWVPTLSTVGNLRGKGYFSEKDLQGILDSALFNVTEFAAMGGLLAPGSDAGAREVFHGVDTETALFALAGVDETRLEPGNRMIRQKF